MKREAKREAWISACGTYRYRLIRTWDESRVHPLVIMLNPSTADAERDDPTIRSLARILSARGYGGFNVVNLFAYRATKPAVLKTVDDPIGPENNATLGLAIQTSPVVICAWGDNARFNLERSRDVVRMVLGTGKHPLCFGLTDRGNPRHPLYVRTAKVLEMF